MSIVETIVAVKNEFYHFSHSVVITSIKKLYFTVLNTAKNLILRWKTLNQRRLLITKAKCRNLNIISVLAMNIKKNKHLQYLVNMQLLHMISAQLLLQEWMKSLQNEGLIYAIEPQSKLCIKMVGIITRVEQNERTRRQQ